MGRLGIVAAMPREIAPLVRGWERIDAEHGVEVYQSEHGLAACAGMGAGRVTYASEALVQMGAAALVSAGWAGGVSEAAQAAAVFVPATVVDAATGERFSTGIGAGTLVSVGLVQDAGGKRDLAARYGADLVDMEAAAVARHAARRGLPFFAVKAISDTRDARMPDMNRFHRDGRFRARRFLAYTALRPWLWPAVARIGRDSARAVRALNLELQRWIEAGGPPAESPK